MSRVSRGGAVALSAALLAVSLFSSSPSNAVVASPEVAGEVRLPGITAVRTEDALQQRALSASSTWQTFRADHGEWTAIWNEATGTPHRAFGTGIALEGFAGDAESVDRGVRRFIEQNPDVFAGAPTLRLVNVGRHGGTWYARYRQTVNGMDVLFADWEFRVHQSGRLTLFGADAVPTSSDSRSSRALPSIESDRGALIAAAVAGESAKRGIAFDPTRDRAEVGSELYLLPYPTEGGLEYRTVYRATVVTTEPTANWLTLVDAHSGDVLLRLNRVRNAITGTVTGKLHATSPQQALVVRPLPDVYVSVGATNVTANASGVYSGGAAGTVTVSATGIRGRYANVNRVDAPNATFSASTTDPATVDIPWGTAGISHVAERDAYYHVNVAHAYIKSLDPGFTGLDYEVPLNVNIPAACNANWNGVGISFFAAGGGCVNSASVPDVVYHEYGHGVNDLMYEQAGVFFGMVNGSLHEGVADVFAAFLEDDPVIGNGFFGPGTFARTVDNANRWPEDNGGEVHNNGLIIGGALWDLRKVVGVTLARQLLVGAMHGTPDDMFDFPAFKEMFLELLVADDNNGNLADGTPHSAAILSSFNKHGIGTNGFITVAHTPIQDFTGNTDTDVVATFAYSGPPITAFNPSSPIIVFRASGGSWSGAPMTATGAPGEYRANIATPNAAIVEYYLVGRDLAGGTTTDPPGAPGMRMHRFAHGTQMTLLTWDMETDPGWVIGDSTADSAFSGVWVWGDPAGTLSGSLDENSVWIQPADDHTANGTLCFVTGNGDSTQGAVFDDVDGGSTTLRTATFSALAPGVEKPAVEYWRWYSNNTGNAPGEDLWRTEISNDNGTTWVGVETTPTTDGEWQRIVFRIDEFVTPTATMKMRFIANDGGDGSLVEAAVDDFRVFAFVTGAADVPVPVAQPLSLAAPVPNPSARTQTLRFTLPEAGHALLRVHDVAGRVVATLADGDLAAGAHSATWTGVDAAGRRAPAGLYFARLTAGGRDLVQRVLRLE